MAYHSGARQPAARGFIRHIILTAAAAALLAGCENGTNPFARKDNPADAEAAPVAQSTSVRLVDRDVEAPQVFQVTDQALWDGRPSLGGVWVASPDAVDPERVILRNPGNGKFVIGALFRRERENPGPKLQISSDAAAALGMLAGAPATLNVTALRREEVADTGPDANSPILDAAETVETSALAPVAVAEAALDEVEAAVPPPAPAPAPAPTAASGGRLIQIGIFSVEANADRAAATLTAAGVPAEKRQETSQGKAFWSVVARGGADSAATLAKVKAAGFADAYLTR
ncbi:SPOR domain-containing protein [Fertoeibacter niger]|uniref:SPOR domain-containing protein n=1 Tax=Fertoeibacter niger TaxID=2656921 RepID=UPI0030B9E5BC